jgi:hypothetical protein
VRAGQSYRHKLRRIAHARLPRGPVRLPVRLRLQASLMPASQPSFPRQGRLHHDRQALSSCDSKCRQQLISKHRFTSRSTDLSSLFAQHPVSSPDMIVPQHKSQIKPSYRLTVKLLTSNKLNWAIMSQAFLWRFFTVSGSCMYHDTNLFIIF